MAKKNAKSEQEDTKVVEKTGKTMADFVWTKEMIAFQKLDEKRTAIDQARPTFPTRLTSEVSDGTILMRIWCVAMLAGGVHLFMTGSNFMMTTNAKFSQNLLAQFFFAQQMIMLVYMLMCNCHIRLEISNFVFLGGTIALELYAFTTHTPAFDMPNAWGLVVLHGAMLLFSCLGYFRTASILNTIPFFIGFWMFTTDTSAPLLDVTYNQLTREFIGWWFTGLAFFTLVNMGLTAGMGNFATSVFWLGIDLLVVEDRTYWKTNGIFSALLLLGIHGSVAGYHQICMFMTASAHADGYQIKRNAYNTSMNELTFKAMKEQGIAVGAPAEEQVEKKSKDL